MLELLEWQTLDNDNGVLIARIKCTDRAFHASDVNGNDNPTECRAITPQNTGSCLSDGSACCLCGKFRFRGNPGIGCSLAGLAGLAEGNRDSLLRCQLREQHFISFGCN